MFPHVAPANTAPVSQTADRDEPQEPVAAPNGGEQPGGSDRGLFQEIIGEIDPHDPQQITRLVFCGGKVYYDLLEARRERKLEHVAIIRIEQLYPFPQALYGQQLERYPNVTDIVWCREEPRTKAPGIKACITWSGVQPHQTLHYAGREPSASPAVGYYSVHVEQQQTLVNQALGR